MLLSILMSSIISLTLPMFDVLGNPLPSTEKLAAVVWEANTLEPVGAMVGYPGEQVSVIVQADYGTWFAVAWIMDTTTQYPVVSSVPSATVTKKRPTCGTSCH